VQLSVQKLKLGGYILKRMLTCISTQRSNSQQKLGVSHNAAAPLTAVAANSGVLYLPCLPRSCQVILIGTVR